MSTDTTTTTQEVHQGRLGFYPCDYDTYRKLKELNRIQSEAWRMTYAHGRWSNKHPQNRFWRKPTFKPDPCNRHHKIEDIPGLPMEEPPRFDKITSKYIHDYMNARMPRFSAKSVIPIKCSLQEIDDLLAEARLWFLGWEEWKARKKEMISQKFSS